MEFNPEKVAFGRHETFALRYGWLSKGFQAVKKDKGIFDSDHAVVELGVGRNMVLAIKYWLKACRMIGADTGESTELGNALLSARGWDPYLEDEATIWLLHWLLATNTELATSWYWFFNRYHKTEFAALELATSLIDFVNDQVIGRKKPSTSTLKNDAGLLPRMYTQSKGGPRAPLEDALDSPFSLLNLVTQSSGGKSYQSRPQSRPNLPLGVLGFAVAELFADKSTSVLPIEDLMYSRDRFSAPGSVFRITENCLVMKLEELIDYIPGCFEMRDTAGQHQLYLAKPIDPVEFVARHYELEGRGVAA